MLRRLSSHGATTFSGGAVGALRALDDLGRAEPGHQIDDHHLTAQSRYASMNGSSASMPTSGGTAEVRDEILRIVAADDAAHDA